MALNIDITPYRISMKIHSMSTSLIYCVSCRPFLFRINGPTSDWEKNHFSSVNTRRRHPLDIIRFGGELKMQLDRPLRQKYIKIRRSDLHYQSHNGSSGAVC